MHPNLRLVLHASENQLSEVKKLIKKNADVNHVEIFEEGGKQMSTTALIEAAGPGHLPIVKELVEHGADVDKPEPCDGRVPLAAAAQGGSAPVIEYLISKGARVDAKSKLGNTPLHMAAAYGEKDAASCLLDHGAFHASIDNVGWTPIMTAAQENKLSVVELLLDRGADPNLTANSIPGREEQTALHIASMVGSFMIVKRLAEGGADVNAQDAQGITSLALAVTPGHVDVVKYLVEKGAEVNLACHKGFSPLHLAAQEGHMEIAKALVARGADIHKVSCYGLTPLHQAALNGRLEVEEYLIKKGAEFEARGTETKTCKFCGATDVPVKKCSGCGIVFYCSPECQKADWKEGGERRHKVQCPRIKERWELAKERRRNEVEAKLAEIGIPRG